MIGRRAIAGLSLLSALLFCAFAAQGASAAKAINTTAFTCVQSGGETNLDFADEHCDEPVKPGTGKWEHKVIPLNETTSLAATNEKVTNETKDSESATLKGNIGLTKTEIHCNKVKNNTANSFIHNVEPESKKHTLTGTAEVEYTDCSVSKPAKCDVKEPIIARATFHGVEGLGAEENTMGIEFNGEIDVNGTFAEITYTEPECSLKEKTFPIRGSVVATSGPGTEASQKNKWAGATLVFTPLKEMQKLQIGSAPENKAEFTNIVTPSMPSGNPISATTTT